MKRRLSSSAIGAAVSALLLLSPALARACAVCGGGPDRMRVAFLISTAFLSLLPLALIFSGLWWLRREAGHALLDEFMDRDDLAQRARREISSAPVRLEPAGETASL